MFKGKDAPEIRPSTMRLKGATGHPLSVVGKVDLVAQFGNITLNHTVHVVEDMKDTFLIGNDLMLDKLSILKGRRLQIEHGSAKAELPIRYRIPRGRVVVAKTTHLVAGTVCLVQCKVVYNSPVNESSIYLLVFIRGVKNTAGA